MTATTPKHTTHLPAPVPVPVPVPTPPAPPQPSTTKAPHQRGWATQREAAALLGLTPDSVRKATRRGLLPCVTINNRLKVIYIDDIERYRREHLGQHPGKSRQRTKP